VIFIGLAQPPRGVGSPYLPCNMESLIIKFTIKYICFYSLFKVRGLETKGNYLREDLVEKRLRATGLEVLFIE